jgi:hypothetical protein
VILKWVRILPSLRGSVDVFVASGGIPTLALGGAHVGIFVGTHTALSFW